MTNKILLTLRIIFILLLASSGAYAQSGKVFQDFNGNGTLDTGEPGVKGIIISSFTAANSLLATATSDGNGNYTLSPAAASGQPVRIEFEIPASMNFYQPSTSGKAYGSNIQFVTGNASNINFAVLNPAKYTEGNPFITTPLHQKGNQMTGPNKDADVLLNINNAWGANSPVGSTTSTVSDWQTPSLPIGLAKAKEIGTTYGVAYSKKRKKIYISAFYRQFCGFGPGGPGAIYQVSVDPVLGTCTAAPSVFADVAAMPGVSVMPDLHGADLTTLTHSDLRLAPTTKNSLGDLEISDDETELYTVNLTSREVIAIDATTGNMINKWAVPTTGLMTSAGPANPNDIRPFGLGYKDGELYVGAVCTGESSVVYDGTYASATGNRNLLHAYVWKLNQTTGVFTLVFDFRMRDMSYRWYCWQRSWANGVRVLNPTDNWPNAPQPILTDIEFYGNDMTLSFRDREGDLWGYEIMDPVTGRFAYGTIQGDIVGAAYNSATGTYTLESNGNIGSRTGTGAYASSGSTEFEFYRGDGATNYTNGHVENAMGGLAQYGAYPLVFSTMAPSISFNSQIISTGGLGWMDNENGNAVKAYIAYEAHSGMGTMGKANGLGDVEVLGGMPPAEIGNRVWLDYNSNGIQDADESGIAAVTVVLRSPGADGIYNNGDDQTWSQVTDANGNYYFDKTVVNDNRRASSWLNASAANSGVLPGFEYRVEIDASQSAVSSLFLTNSHGTIRDEINSDGSQSGNLISAVVNSGGPTAPGSSFRANYNIDFGFSYTVLPVNQLNISARLTSNRAAIKWETKNEENIFTYYVERSVSGADFTTIANSSSKGNGSFIYDAADDIRGISASTIYYRIKTVGKTGTVKYSNIAAVKPGLSIKLNVGPNPFANALTIQMVSDVKANAVIRIISLSGKTVHQQTTLIEKGNNSFVIDELGRLAKGIYVVEVRTADRYQRGKVAKL